MELCKQACFGDVDGVRRLVEKGFSVNSRNDRNQTALYCACEHGRTAVAKYLLDNGVSVNNLGQVPLIAAVKNNHLDCVKLLLQYNADIRCTNSKGQSPVSVALQSHHYPIIMLLFQHAAVPPGSPDDIAIQLLKQAKVEDAEVIERLIGENLVNLMSRRIFLAACRFAFKRGSVRLAERMLSNDSHANVEKLYPGAAYYSAKNNWPNILTELFQKGVDVHALTHDKTPLYAACQEGHESAVSLLLDNGADPNVPNDMSSEGLMLPVEIAVRHGNVAIWSMLLEKGAELKPLSDVPLLHIACGAVDCLETSRAATRSVEQMLSTIRMLLQRGVNVNALSEDGVTALYWACRCRHLHVVQMLLEAGADVNLTSTRDYTYRCYPLIAACNTGNIELIDVILNAGADVKCSTRDNETSLLAALSGCASVMGSQGILKPNFVNTIKTLIEGGVDINVVCSKRETALYKASRAGLDVIVHLLLEAGADTGGSTRCRPLYAACEHGHTQVVDLLLQYGADSNVSPEIPGSETSGVSSPLCCALKKGYTDIVSLLVKHGADINREDPSGKTPLILCIESLTSQRCTVSHAMSSVPERNLDILRCMLLAGGDVNKKCGRDSESALHVASSHGMCDVMTELIQHGANCNQLTSWGKTALELACEKGHEAAVGLLLKNGTRPDRRTRGSCRVYLNVTPLIRPALCIAAMNGSETMVKMLIEHAADANATDMHGNTALHLASTNAIIETLLNIGADAINVNALNHSRDTALSVVCKKGQTDANVVEMLLRLGADPNAGSALSAACTNSDGDTVRLLLAHGADANPVKRCKPWLFGGCLIEPLSIACAKGNIDMVDCLLKNGADANFADGDGNRALHVAVRRLDKAQSEDYDPVVTLLLQHNAVVNVVSDSGETPLYVACMKGLLGVAKQLLDSRADVNLTTSDSANYPLLIACQRNFRDVAVMLLDRGANANVSSHSATPLKLASANGDAVLVKQLLACGADVNQMLDVSDTALHSAIVRCNNDDDCAFIEIVRMLLKAGAKVNAHNAGDETPLDLACSKADGKDKAIVDIAEILLEHGADANTSPASSLPPLSSATAFGNNELVMLLIKFGATLDLRDRFDRTALHYVTGTDIYRFSRRLQSTKSDTVSTAQTLLSAGSDVNVTDSDGESPLYLACKRGKTEFAEMLLSHGVSANNGTNYKYPIHAACRGKHYDALKLLLEYNADANVRDENGKTALHHLLESDDPHFSDIGKGSDLVQLLVDKGADLDATSYRGATPLFTACWKGVASLVGKMLECGAKMDVNNGTQLPLNVACSNGHMSVVQLLLTNGADPNIPAGDEYRHGCTLPLHIAAAFTNTKLVALLVKHGANVNAIDVGSGHTALHHAVEHHGTNTIMSLLNAGANVNATNRDGRSVAGFAAENMTDSINYRHSTKEMRRSLSTILLLLRHGAKFSNLTDDGRSPLHSVVANLFGDRHVHRGIALLQLMVKHGAMIRDSDAEQDASRRQSLDCETLHALATFDGKHGFIIDMFRAGAGIELVADCCKAVVTRPGEAKSIVLCQAAVLAGYTPSSRELQNLQRKASGEIASDGVQHQLVKWLDEDRQQVPSLLRQCRVAIRRQLSAAAHYQTILPAIEKLPLPNDVNLYLKFDGPITEVDLNVRKKLQNCGMSSTESIYRPSPYNSDCSDFDRSDDEEDICVSDSDSDNDSDSNFSSDGYCGDTYVSW